MGGVYTKSKCYVYFISNLFKDTNVDIIFNKLTKILKKMTSEKHDVLIILGRT